MNLTYYVNYCVIPLPSIRVADTLPEMLPGHPVVENIMLQVPFKLPELVEALTDIVKGDVSYPGGAELFVAVPVAVNEMELPAIITGAQIKGPTISALKYW